MIAGVMGWPIAHSLSPRLHGAWIDALGLDAAYVPFPVHPDRVADAFTGLRALGVRGVNVTLPHKHAALAAGEGTAAARAVGAANMVMVSDDALVADNSDVAGFWSSLPDRVRAVPGRALIIGAGGAARAAVHAFCVNGHTVCVTNRTDERASDVAGAFGPMVTARRWSERHAAARDVDVVVNASAAGMGGGPALDFSLDHTRDDTVVYDMVYTPIRTPLIDAARARGLTTVDGLGMLIGQARISFEAFFGVPAPNSAVLDARALLLDTLGPSS